MSWALHGRGAGNAVSIALLKSGGWKGSLTAVRTLCSTVDPSANEKLEVPSQTHPADNRQRRPTELTDEESEGTPFGQESDLDLFNHSNDEAYSSPPWQSLLDPAARALWRSSSQGPPHYLAQEHFSILQEGDRTSRQLRRTYKHVVKSHMALAERRERERRRVVNRGVAADSLSHKRDLNRDSQVSPVYYGPEQTLSYLKHRLLPNYAIVKRVLMETQSLLGGGASWEPRRIIDFGIGCGSASASAVDVFDKLEWIHGIDPSRSMRDGAERVLQTVSGQKSGPAPRVTLSETLSTERTNASFDVALFAYTALELPHVSSTLAAAAVLWEKLRPGGVLIMIEPGTPDGFNSVRAVRNMLLECCPPGISGLPGDEQCHVLAPCTHNGKCPMERHQRNYEQRKSMTSNADHTIGWDELESELEELDRVDTTMVEEVDVSDDEDAEINFSDILSETEDSFGDEVETKNSMAETDVFNRAFCSFVHTFPGGSRRSSGEKFSYLAVQKRIHEVDDSKTIPSQQESNPLHDANVTELLAKTFRAGKSVDSKGKRKRRARDQNAHTKLLEEAQSLQELLEASKTDKLSLELLHGDGKRQSFGRIVRAPLKRRGLVLVDYCSSDPGEAGRIVRHRVSKGWSARVAPGMYSAARKARWGGFWPNLKSRVSDNQADAADKQSKDGE